MPQGADLRIRRGTAASWASINPTLNSGEIGVETDTLLMKIGDGSTAWSSLAYFGVALPSLAVATSSSTTLSSTTTESFVGTDGAAWPAHFTGTLNSNASRTLLGNNGVLVTPNTGSYISSGNTVASGVASRVDAEVQVDVSFADTAEQYFGISLRATNSSNGAGPTNGYYLQLNVNSNGWQIARCNSATTTNVSPIQPFTYTANTVVHVRFRAVGSTLYGKVWTGSTEPSSWSWSGIDSSPYMTTGTYALGYSNGSAGTAKTATISAASLSTVTGGGGSADLATFTNGVSTAQLAVDYQARLRFPDASLQATAGLPLTGGTLTGSVKTAGQSGTVASYTGSHTFLATDDTAFFTGTSGTAALPSASANPGKIYRMRNCNTGSITITGGPVKTSSSASITAIAAGVALVVQSDGTSWWSM